MAAFLIMPDGTEIEIEDGMILGRVKGCHLVIEDAKASRRHARVICQRGVVEIEDLKSSNGTKLNGKTITRRMLRDGDVILIGKTSINYAERASAPAAPAPGFAGGDDLFHDEPSSPPVPSPPVPSPPEPVSRTRPEPPDESLSEVEVRQPSETGPVAEPDSAEEVLEFADDDVVVVKRALPEPGKKASKSPQQVGEVGRAGGVLQFQRVEDKGGLFGHDFGQMPLLQRLVMFLIAVVVAGLLFYAAMHLAASW